MVASTKRFIRPWGGRRAAFGIATCLLAACLGMVSSVTTAHATVMRELPLAELAQTADVIVRAEVVRSGARASMRQDGTMELSTLTQVRVRQWLKGPHAAGEVIDIIELGGEDPQLGAQWFAGTPRYRAREDVVVFLRWDSAMQGYRTLGMSQGKFRVVPGVGSMPDTVVRDLDDLAYASWVDQTMVVRDASDTALQLDPFLALIRDEVRRAGGVQ